MTDGGYISAPGSFLFSFRNPEELPPFKAPLKNQDTQYALCRYTTSGPSFGGGLDLFVASNANANSLSSSNFGYSYQPPLKYTGRTPKHDLLTGGKHFTPSEVEVLFLT